MPDAIRELAARLASFFRRRDRDEEFDAELSAHFDLAYQDNLDRGLAPEDARREALLRIGGMEQAREMHRDSRGVPALETLLQDLRYAIRGLRRDARLALFAIAVAGFGVGAAATVFSLCHALLFRPLPFDDPGRLYWIANGESANLSNQTVQVGNLLAFREQSRSFSGVAGYSPFYGPGDIRLTGAGEPERLTGVPVTEDFFRLLGVQPRLGRFFTADECQRRRPPSATVLTHHFWERRFASDPAIVGRNVMLDGNPVTVAGVLPASFDFAGVFTPGSRIDLFLPFPLTPETDRMGNTLALVGRLKPDVPLEAAQAEATLIGERIAAERHARRNGFAPRIRGLREQVSGRFRSPLLLLAGAVGLVLLIVCANLSNLLLARASARQREMAIRAALGASRGRLIRQALTESLTLSCCGATLGLALAAGGTRLIAGIEGTTVPLLAQVRVDLTALGVALLVALATGVTFGIVPALQSSAFTPQGALKQGGRGSIGGSRDWIRGALVVCEFAFACALLTTAGLLARSLVRVLDADPGFRHENVLALRIDPGRDYSTLARKTAYFDEVLGAVREVRGVEAAGLTDALPLGQNYGWRNWTVAAKGKVYERGQRPLAMVRVVDDHYLGVMRIALKAGRAFTPRDGPGSEPVILLNEEAARMLWPGEEPLGQVVRASETDRRVVGVVRGVRYFGLDQDSGAEMYLPIRQSGDYSSVDLVIRTSRAPSDVAPGVRAALKRVDATLPVTEFRTMQQLVDRSVFARRFLALLMTGFADFAIVLAALGIYGVISYSVSRRRQEIGIRMALGASGADVQKRILAQTLKLAAVGLALGLAASWALGRTIRGLLFEVEPSDPATFAAMAGTLTAVALLAGYLPARRASRMDPLDALRTD